MKMGLSIFRSSNLTFESTKILFLTWTDLESAIQIEMPHCMNVQFDVWSTSATKIMSFLYIGRKLFKKNHFCCYFKWHESAPASIASHMRVLCEGDGIGWSWKNTHARTQPANWIGFNWKIHTIDSVRRSFRSSLHCFLSPRISVDSKCMEITRCAYHTLKVKKITILCLNLDIKFV